MLERFQWQTPPPCRYEPFCRCWALCTRGECPVHVGALAFIEGLHESSQGSNSSHFVDVFEHRHAGVLLHSRLSRDIAHLCIYSPL